MLTLSIAASYVRQRDRMPALVFCLACYMHHFATGSVGEPLIYFATAAFDLATLKMITTLDGVMRSRFNAMICWMLLLSIVIQAIGFLLYYANWPISTYNNMAYAYYFGMIVLFISRGEGDGINNWHPRFLRDHTGGNKNSSQVSR